MSKKYFIISALVFSFSFSVNAAASEILAQKVITGGFIKQPPRGIRILRSGLVESYAGEEVHALGMLYLTSKDELVSLVERSASKLEDTEPQAPSCVDGYNTNYAAFRVTGEEIVVAKRISCHTFISQNLLTIKNMLDGFSALDKSFKPSP
jgi:hypothetical protein